MRLSACLLALVMWNGLVPRDGSAANLAANPNFEQGEKTPTEWSFNHRRTESEISWDKERANDGKACVRIVNADRSQTGNVVQAIRLDPPLEPGSRITFSAMAACEDLNRDGPRIVVYLESSRQNRETAVAGGPGGTHDFLQVGGKATVRRRTDRLVVYLCNYGVGTLWWDDVCVNVERAAARQVLARPTTSDVRFSLATQDGLTLALDDSGAVGQTRLDGRTISWTFPNSGLWVTPFDGDTHPVAGDVTAAEGVVRQQWKSGELGLRVLATFRAESQLIRCVGTVEDLTGRDRGVDVFFSLPAGAKGWRWGQSIRNEVAMSSGPHTVDTTTFSSLSDTATGDGLALAVPADSPSDCEFTWSEEFGYAVRFRCGLSDAASGSLKSRAPFSFVLYRCDGHWGLRDAARRYYTFWPWAFEKRVQREGLWMFGSAGFSIPDPQNYTFHEGGPVGWQYDDGHEILTCPYIIPGQREITRLDNLPENRQEALELFRQFGQPAEGVSSQRPGKTLQPSATAKSKRRSDWGDSLKAIIESCMLFDADGLPHVRIRNSAWGGNSITFPLNADPSLFDNTDQLTVAKALLGHVAELFKETPTLDGIYVDSLGAWGSYLNHRRQHFAFAQVPLTYDQRNGRPVVHNRFALLEFLWQLSDDLHDRGKILFANGVHHDRRFHFFALDVMGVEGHGRMEQKRVMSFQKPFLLLIYNIHDSVEQMEHYYHLCTLYGLYPSFANMRVYETPQMYAPVATLNNRFVPALRAITGAGWQPITHARSSHADVWLERWGPDAAGVVYLTAYNSAETEQNVALDIETNRLGLRGARLQVDDLLSEHAWQASIRKEAASVKIGIPAKEVRVLRLGTE